MARNGGVGYRYEYQGAYAEKDQVTGFNNFELRMYDGKIGRWLSTDPMGQYASPYEGMGNNPVTGFDKTGGIEEKPDGTPLYDAGDWHVSDRLANNDVWKNANLYNMQNGNSDQYQTITQRDSYYSWYAVSIKNKGFDNMWPAAASVVAWNMGFLDNPVMAWWVGPDVVKFGNDGNKAIFDDVFDNLTALYNGPVMKGSIAAAWDAKTLHHEQFDVGQPLYLKQTKATISTLSKMAKGQSIYDYGMIDALRFHGDLLNPQDRYNYGAKQVVPFVKAVYKTR